MNYRHTQVSWISRLGLASGGIVLLFFGIAAPGSEPAAARVAMIVGGMLMAVIGYWMSMLTISIDRSRVSWHFGLGWPRKSIALNDIESVEATRTRFWDGWGIRWTKRGWLYNVAGYDAVLIRRRTDKALLLGSDEVRKLAHALERALTARR
jgi:hypothetical protein